MIRSTIAALVRRALRARARADTRVKVTTKEDYSKPMVISANGPPRRVIIPEGWIAVGASYNAHHLLDDLLITIEQHERGCDARETPRDCLTSIYAAAEDVRKRMAP